MLLRKVIQTENFDENCQKYSLKIKMNTKS